jgi:DNA-binding transcriptional LysR family regulator
MRVSEIDLKHLRYFVAVAEELHFTRAAARLRISQPPLSQIIHRLESSLGCKLFERTKRNVTLTEAGSILLQESRAILSRAKFAVHQARRAARGDIGQLKVAFVPWADFTAAFSEVFRAYGEKFSGVMVDFHSMSAPTALVALDEGRIDVAFVAISSLTGPPRGFSHEVVLADSIKVALPEKHRLAHRKLVPLKELAAEPQIVVSHDRHGSFYQLADVLFQRAGLSIQVRHIIDHPQMTLALVAAGAGVSLVPASYENVSRPGVVYRPIKPTVKVRLIAAWKSDDRMAALRTFLDTMRQITTKRLRPDRRAPSKRVRRMPRTDGSARTSSRRS